MLNSEQKARLEVLEAIENLKADEAEELSALQALIPEDPNQDAFDAEWDELDGKTIAQEEDSNKKEKTLEEIEADQKAQLEKEKDKSQSTDSTETDGDILNPAPADSDTKPDSADLDGTTDTRDAELAKMRVEQEAQAQKMRSWEGRIKAAEKRAATAEQKLKDAETKGQSDSDASPDEDDAELGAFFKEYPDLEGPMKKVAEKLATKIFNEKIGDKIETLETKQVSAQETADAQADEEHMAKINAAHPNWKTIYDSGALDTWIKRQPGYLQPRLYEILKDGSATEVIDMFDSYNRAAGKGKETTTNSVSPEKKAKAKVIEAVPASTGGPKRDEVKITEDDFDGAWDDLEEKDKAKQK